MKGFNIINSFKKIFIKLIFNYPTYRKLNLFLSINLILLSGCSTSNKKVDVNICSRKILPCISSTEYVLLITNKGEMKLELFGKLAPITVGNFIDLVEKGAYDKTIFNRVIKKPYPFIIRGGEINYSKNSKDLNNFIDRKTVKIRYIPLEIKLKNKNLPTYGKIIDVSSQKNDIELKHKRAYLSMARSKYVNSANSQFYISLKALPELDGRFAVFGKVISGLKVLDKIEEKDFIIEAIRL